MQRFLASLAITALLASWSGAAMAEDGGRGPAGGAFMSSYSTPPGGYVQPSTATPSTFAVQREVRESAAQPRFQNRRSRAAR